MPALDREFASRLDPFPNGAQLGPRGADVQSMNDDVGFLGLRNPQPNHHLCSLDAPLVQPSRIYHSLCTPVARV